MRNGLRKVMDVALGATASGWDSLQERTLRYAERGRARREQVRERVDKEAAAWKESGRYQAHWLEERVREEVHRALRRAHLVTREEYDALERELQQLRRRLAEVERRSDQEAGPGPEEGGA